MSPENKRALKNALYDSEMSQSEIARQTRMSRQSINDVIWGRNGNKKLIAKVVSLIGFDFTRYHN